MIGSFFAHEGTCAQLSAGPLGPHIESLAARLVEEGFSKDSALRELRAAATFGRWLADQGVALDEANEHVEDYIARLGGEAGERRRAATGVEHFVEVLRERGVLRPSATPQKEEGELWIAAFDEYLLQVASVASGTRTQYLRVAKRFVEGRFGNAPPVWSALTPDDITGFVLRDASRRRGTGRRGAVAGTKALLKFLIISEEIPPGLMGAVPRVRECRLTSLPRYLSREEVARLLSSVDEGRAAGLRDKAILLTLVRLGLRASEVVHLDLDDVKWTEALIVVRSSKVLRERCLPLPHEVGAAIARYLKQPRPRIAERALYIRCLAPRRRLTSSAVTALVIRHLGRLGVKMRPLGAHTLRHTIATELVRHGATFKDVADLLGHRRLASTQVYAKLDLASLGQVGLPWPGGAQ